MNSTAGMSRVILLSFVRGAKKLFGIHEIKKNVIKLTVNFVKINLKFY